MTTPDNTDCAGNPRRIPTKAEVTTAMQEALTAALAIEEPWGNLWATCVLGALCWRANEAVEGSAVLMEILSDAGAHARVALHGTHGYRHVGTLESLWIRWYLALPSDDTTPPKPDAYYRALSAAMRRQPGRT